MHYTAGMRRTYILSQHQHGAGPFFGNITMTAASPASISNRLFSNRACIQRRTSGGEKA